ncbi:unnamed protein product [Musa banksii]
MDCLDVGIDIPPLVYTSLSHFFDTRRTEQVREFDVQEKELFMASTVAVGLSSERGEIVAAAADLSFYGLSIRMYQI